jgi:murein DD-endopeptidase MepM/ murein hydrolase activator NlpD
VADALSTLAKQISNLDGSIKKLSTTVGSLTKSIGKNGKGGGGGGGGGGTAAGGSGNPLNDALSNISSGFGGILGGIATMATGVVRGAVMAMPDVSATIQRAAGYYTAGVQSGGVNRTTIGRATFNALGGGLSGVGSDVAVAQHLAGSGMMFSTAANSTYMQTVRGVGNAAKYLNMDNQSAAVAIEGLTSGQTSANLMQTMGIFTADPRTGKEYTQGQIFGQIADRLTMGQRKASVSDTMASIRRGNLGAFLQNSGFSEDQQTLFKQYMIDRAKGKNMDLSSNSDMAKLQKDAGLNPNKSSMDIYASETSVMNSAEQPYIKGMKEAVGVIGQLNDVVKKDLIPNFGQLNSMLQTVVGSRAGGGAAQAGSSIIQGLGQIGGGIIDGVMGILKLFGIGGPATEIGLGASSGGAPTGGGGGGMTKPLSGGTISARYGEKGKIWARGYHAGMDWATPEGSAVYAVADGVVDGTSPGSGPYSYGKNIVIDHGNGLKTRYAHLSMFEAHVGQKVSAGQEIGKSGKTGHTTGAALHFEVIQNGTMVNPEPYLSGAKTITSTSTTADGKTKKTGDPHYHTVGFDSIISTGISGVSPVSQTLSQVLGAQTSSTDNGLKTTTTNDGLAKGGPATGNALGAYSGASITSSGVSGGNHVTINLSIAKSSDEEAKRFANLVKQYLETDNRLVNMGSF